jgi:type III pantothenate kinase
MILEIDAGNTRIKWRLVQTGREKTELVGAQGALVVNENSSNPYEEFGNELTAMPLASINRILVASVRGGGFREFLVAWLARNRAVRPEFAQSTASCVGVTNGYSEPARLGVDRWLAILAAYNVARAACVIVNCGTTITVDQVAGGGRHLGGFIVPGISLMRDSLAHRSSALAQAVPGEILLEPGLNTASAINNGVVTMITGFLQHVKNRQAVSGANSVWFISGGDGELVGRYLDWECHYVSTLVLDGLRLALP